MTDPTFFGRWSDINLADGATLSGGSWASELPLANLQTWNLTDEPARCADLGSMDAGGLPTGSTWLIVLARQAWVDELGLFTCTTTSSARLRWALYGDAAATDLRHDSGWSPTVPRLYPSLSLEWSDPNWWTGRASDADLDAYGRHIWRRLSQRVSTRAIKVWIDDRDHPDGHLDLGALWVGQGWRAGRNFSVGQTLGLDFRDLSDMTPSGHAVIEQRRAGRTMRVTYRTPDKTDVMRLFDIAKRHTRARPLVFDAYPQDLTNRHREVFPALLREIGAPTRDSAATWSISLTIEEIIT